MDSTASEKRVGPFALVRRILLSTALFLFVVIALIAMSFRVTPHRDHVRFNVNKARMLHLAAAIDAFVDRHGAAPESLELLLTDRELSLGVSSSFFRDRWKEPFVYEVRASPEPGGVPYTLRSKGPDRIDQTSDDITLESVREVFPD